MQINVIELISSIISDAEVLLADFTKHESNAGQQKIEAILSAAHFIETELKFLAANDGIIHQVDQSKESYARTPFAMLETSIYLLRNLNQLGEIGLSDDELERVGRIENNIKMIKHELDSLWSGDLKET